MATKKRSRTVKRRATRSVPQRIRRRAFSRKKTSVMLDKIISILAMRVGVNLASSFIGDKIPALSQYSDILLPQIVKIAAQKFGIASASFNEVADTMTAIGAADMISSKLGFSGINFGALGEVNDVSSTYPVHLSGIVEPEYPSTYGALADDADMLDSEYPTV